MHWGRGRECLGGCGKAACSCLLHCCLTTCGRHQHPARKLPRRHEHLFTAATPLPSVLCTIIIASSCSDARYLQQHRITNACSRSPAQSLSSALTCHHCCPLASFWATATQPAAEGGGQGETSPSFGIFCAVRLRVRVAECARRRSPQRVPAVTMREFEGMSVDAAGGSDSNLLARQGDQRLRDVTHAARRHVW